MTEQDVFIGFFLFLLVNVLTLRLIRYTFRHHDDGFRELEDQAKREGHHYKKEDDDV